VEAMMERHERWQQQLDLLELAATAVRQRLDPAARAELIGLLKLLINECSVAVVKTVEADNEQDHV
jgi:hypothetical protein